MGLKYGLNITKESAANALAEHDRFNNGVKAWDSLFNANFNRANDAISNISMQYGANRAASASNYNQDIISAYRANLQRSNALASAGLGINATEEGLAMSRRDLLNTYSQVTSAYGNNLAVMRENAEKGIGQVIEGYDEAQKLIQGQLDTRSENVAGILNATKDYFYNMTGNTWTDKEGNDYDILTNLGLNWVRDEEGNILEWDKLAPILYDADGTLTDKGRVFYDTILNVQGDEITGTDAEGNTISFSPFEKYLSDKNSELYEWYAGADEFGGEGYTHANLINEITGREADDFDVPVQLTDESGNLITKDISIYQTNATKVFDKYDKDITEINKRLETALNNMNAADSARQKKGEALMDSVGTNESTYRSFGVINSENKYNKAENEYNEALKEKQKIENYFKGNINNMLNMSNNIYNSLKSKLTPEQFAAIEKELKTNLALLEEGDIEKADKITTAYKSILDLYKKHNV